MAVRNVWVPSKNRPLYYLPGFVLLDANFESAREAVCRSCDFCDMDYPIIQLDETFPDNLEAEIYICNTLVATSSGSTSQTVLQDVWQNAFENLKELCYTIKQKDLNNNEMKSDEKDLCQKVLEMMGWKKERMNLMHVVHLSKNLGIGSEQTNRPFNKKKMCNFQRELKKNFLKFKNTQKKILTFSAVFSKVERKFIYLMCTQFNFKMKFYGPDEKKYVVVFNNRNVQEIFESLVASGYENDNYILLPPEYLKNNS